MTEHKDFLRQTNRHDGQEQTKLNLTTKSVTMHAPHLIRFVVKDDLIMYARKCHYWLEMKNFVDGSLFTTFSEMSATRNVFFQK